jgi:hypothetical protein
MALLFMDSFDLYDAIADAQEAGWTTTSSSYTDVTNSTGRFSGGAVRVQYSASLNRPINTGDATIVIQSAFKLESLADATNENFLICTNNSDADQCFRLVATEAGELKLYNSANSLIATSSAGIIKEGIWQYLEVKSLIADSGTVTVKVDEVQVLNEGTIDTSISATDVTLVKFCSGSDDATFGTYWDDIVIMDGTGSQMNDFIGDCKISVLLPNADSTPEQWSTSTGSDSYALIDDTVPGDHDGDSTYIEHATATEKTQVTLGNMSETPTAIYAVGTAMSVKKTDSGSKTMRAYLDSNSTVSNGATQSPTTDYQTLRDYWEVDPDTTSAWSKSGVDALEVGVEVVS